MRYEKIITDKRGTTVIEVKFWSDATFGKDRSGNEFRYDIIIWNTPPKKRNRVYQNEDFCTAAEI